MNFVKSETLYLSENEIGIICKVMNLLDTISDHASNPEIRILACKAHIQLRDFYESEFVQPAEADPDFWQQSTESEEYTRDEDEDDNLWRFFMEAKSFPPQSDEMATNDK